MQILRSATDLDARKFDIKQFFLDQARHLQARTHNEEQTNGRISQTIVRIQSREAKRHVFPGFFGLQVDRHLGPPPGLAEEYCLTVKHYRLYKPYIRNVERRKAMKFAPANEIHQK